MTRTPSTDLADRSSRKIPSRILLLSILALVVPLWVTVAAPDWVAHGAGRLVWLTALLPPFLLTYYRGWKGASFALLGGVEAVALGDVIRVALGVAPPTEGAVVWIVASLVAVSLGAGMLSEILHRSLRRAEERSLVDALTGLPNRRHATLFLESAFAAASRGNDLTVVLFDLDAFKEVNDRRGHAEGDKILALFGRILADRTRKMNISARWGGEEFIAVLFQSDAEGARTFAEHVRIALQKEKFPWGRVTVSAGVAEHREDMESIDDIIAAADHALYRAKWEGRNRVVVAVPGEGPRGTGDEDDEAEVPDVASADEGGHGERGQGEVVLVVDDDRDARRSVARALARHGYHVLEAEAPEEAIEIALGREEPPDLVVTDVVMPSMSGFRMVERLQAAGLARRVLYISGYPQEDLEPSRLPGGASELLSKPMALEDLIAAARRLLASPREVEPAPVVTRTVVAAPPRAAPEDGARDWPGWGEDLRDARILIVDDDAHAAEGLARLLAATGFGEVRTSAEPGDLPSLLARFDPDAVLLDLHMPDLDGIEVLKGVAPFLSGPSFVPVVAVTGDGDPELRRRALAAGASDFITKPPESWELSGRLRNLLRVRFTTRRLREERERLEARVTARTAELEEARTETLLRLARASEYRDDLTGRHAERVGTLSYLLARALGLDPEVQDLLRRAAPLHDVGKIGIPDAILRKPGSLTEEETAAMRRHTVIGAEILGGSRVPVLSTAREIALHHHERWDGSGYPHGLRGEDIPLTARVVAVADVHDSLSHDRPYRGALTPHATLSYIKQRSGGLFDPEVVDALCELERSGELEQVDIPQVAGTPGRTSDPSLR